MPINSNIKQILCDVPEAAKSLHISQRTLWGLAKRGLITRVKIGRRVYYDPIDLREFVNRQKEVKHAAS